MLSKSRRRSASASSWRRAGRSGKRSRTSETTSAMSGAPAPSSRRSSVSGRASDVRAQRLDPRPVRRRTPRLRSNGPTALARRACARRRSSSSASRVLPMPGSPTSSAAWPCPDSTSSSTLCAVAPPRARDRRRRRVARAGPADWRRHCGAGAVLSARGAARCACSASSTRAALSGRSPGPSRGAAAPALRAPSAPAGLCHVGATGAVLMCCEMMATASSPRNGGRPVSIS